jgi:ABC-2 type transport system ATP-binding protein
MRADRDLAVQVRNLSKSYGRVQALQGLDLDIARGEIFAILGPNGAGKSTTIEILEGHRKRDAGQVSVLGEDPGSAGRSWRARIGIVLQETSDFGMLTVQETVQMFAKCYGAARTSAELLELVGLAPSARSRVRTLSGGQRRRLDVALGIIGYPELLFLDEPTTGFDPEARRAFWDLIRLLASDGTTIVLTTHYLEEAAALADRVAVVTGGRLAALDSPAHLTAHAASAATVTWMDGDAPQVYQTDRPTELIRRLSTEGNELAQLTVTRPTLEDAYLSLIEGGPR